MRSRVLVALLVAMLGAQASVALTPHPDQSGSDFDFTAISETSSFGDPEPLFRAPSATGNVLRFAPLTFSASAAGAGSFDQTGAQLQATVTATGSKTIGKILIDEFGDLDLSGIGTPATGAFISMSGVVTVLETGAGVPCPACQIPFVGVFTPSDLYGLPGDQGQTLFQGSVSVDVGALHPNATKALLSFDNDIVVFSESGTTGLLQKKIVLVTIEPVE